MDNVVSNGCSVSILIQNLYICLTFSQLAEKLLEILEK